MTSDITALDGAKLVQTYEYNDSWNTVVVLVWHGGTQTNVYSVYDGEWDETDVFTLSDENGKAVSREEMSEHMDEWIETETSCKR